MVEILNLSYSISQMLKAGTVEKAVVAVKVVAPPVHTPAKIQKTKLKCLIPAKTARSF